MHHHRPCHLLLRCAGHADPLTGRPLDGAALTIAAFETVLGPAAGALIALGIVLFAFSSILGWAYQGETALRYLTGGRAVPLYRLLFTLGAYAGAVGRLETVFSLSDLCNGLMALPNLVCLLLLSGTVAGRWPLSSRSWSGKRPAGGENGCKPCKFSAMELQFLILMVR